MWLLIVDAVGAMLAIALFFAALVPSKGNSINPLGGVVSIVGFAISLWVAWYALSIPREARQEWSAPQQWPSTGRSSGGGTDASPDAQGSQ